MGARSFCLCYEIKSLTLPPSLRRIGMDAFDSYRIKHLDVPDSVTSVEGGALNMGNLRSATVGYQTKLDPAAFAGWTSVTVRKPRPAPAKKESKGGLLSRLLGRRRGSTE